MRYELVEYEPGVFGAIRDNQTKPGDFVCGGPSRLNPKSAEHWPENARRIVALLNAYENLTTEEIEDFASKVQICKEAFQPMELPIEAHVEFADDTQPAQQNVQCHHPAGCTECNWCGFKVS